MLFFIKKRTMFSIVLTLVFASVSILLKHLLGLDWNLCIGEETLAKLILALGFILGCDLAACLLLVTVFHTAFVRLWMEMASYFSAQRAHTVLAGGFLAAGEEMFFRGVLLQYLVESLGLGNFSAVAVSAAVFALFHVIWKKRLALFSLWAFWEGVVLGAIYLYTDSLPVVMAVHAAHDIAGFTLFSLQRRKGFLLGIVKN